MTVARGTLTNDQFAQHMRRKRHHPLAPVPQGALIWDGEVILKDPKTGYLHPNAHPDDIQRSAAPALGMGTPEDPGCVLKVHTYKSPTSGQQRTMISYFPRHNGMNINFEILAFVRGPATRKIEWFRVTHLAASDGKSRWLRPCSDTGVDVEDLGGKWFDDKAIAARREDDFNTFIHVAIYAEHVPPGWGRMAVIDPNLRPGKR